MEAKFEAISCDILK